jgi:hypothetical protein
VRQFEAGNVIYSGVAIVFDIRLLHVHVDFIIVLLIFTIETIYFHTTCKLSSFFAMKERQEENSILEAVFICHFILLCSEHFLLVHCGLVSLLPLQMSQCDGCTLPLHLYMNSQHGNPVKRT